MDDIRNARTICWQCAKDNGATGDGVHTVYEDTCDVCKQRKGVSTVDDWNWPANRRPRNWSIHGRD